MDKKEIKEYIIKLGLTIAIISIIALFVMGIIYAEYIGALIHHIISILMPFIIGACIAYLLTPLCNKIEYKFNKCKHNKLVAIIISELILVLLVVILCSIILPQSIKSVTTIVNSMPTAYKNTVEWLNDLIKEHKWIRETFGIKSINIEQLLTNIINNYVTPNINEIVTRLANGATSIVEVIFNIIIGLIVNIFALANRKNFASYTKKIINAILGKKVSKLVIEEMNIANKMFSGFLIGKIVDSTIIGIMCFISMSIMKLPYALLISVIVGVTNIIPFFGPFIGAIPGTIIIFSVSPIQSLYFIMIIFILQQIDGNIIGPKCIGNATKLSTFWVLFAILFFGGLWGVIGMVIGVPLLAVIFDIIDKIINKLLIKRDIKQGSKEDNN